MNIHCQAVHNLLREMSLVIMKVEYNKTSQSDPCTVITTLSRKWQESSTVDNHRGSAPRPVCACARGCAACLSVRQNLAGLHWLSALLTLSQFWRAGASVWLPLLWYSLSTIYIWKKLYVYVNNSRCFMSLVSDVLNIGRYERTPFQQ